MKPPVEPREEDCCNSGCNPCIFDVYQKQLERYNRNKNGDYLYKQNGIYELEYTAFVVIDTIPICDTHKILKFKKLNNEEYIKVWWNPGDHFLVKYTSKKSSCSRAYTPIKLKIHSNEDFNFMIVIKRYNDGLVSNYLHNLEIGEVIMWRGPYGHYKIESNKYNRIIMIAQGTGIAPFMSIIDNIRKEYVRYAKVFPFTELLDFKVPSKWYRRTVGGLEILFGLALAIIPSHKVKNAANIGLVLLMVLAAYSHVMVGDPFDRCAPALVFFFMLTGRLVVWYQTSRREELEKAAATQNGDGLKRD